MNGPLPPRFRRRLVRIIRDQRQIIRDIEWFNVNRQDATPTDVGCDKVVLSLAVKALAAFDRGDWDEHAQLTQEMADASDRVYRDREEDDAQG